MNEPQIHIVVNEIWRHLLNGDYYVVAYDETVQRVIYAAGPLHYSELSIALTSGFDSDCELAAELDRTRGEYADVTSLYEM